MARDPDAKKQRLLDAALEEFAEHGIGGARIDRIAKSAGISAGLVYSHYAGKQELFEAVYDRIVEAVAQTAPITPDDLADYAGKLYDAARANPTEMRFIHWYTLERGDDKNVPASVTQSMKDKVAAIEDAQHRGAVTDHFSAGQILALVLSLANMWQIEGDGTRNLVAIAQHRDTITTAIRQLTTPGN